MKKVKTRKAMAASAAGGTTVVGDDESAPTQEQIAALAYSFWEARGGAEGSAEEDWIRAENELRTRAS